MTARVEITRFDSHDDRNLTAITANNSRLPDQLSLSLVAGIAEQVAFEHFIENVDKGETADGHD